MVSGTRGSPDQCLKRRAAHLIVLRVVRERPEVQLVVHRVHSGDRVGVLDRRVALLEALDAAAEGDDSSAGEYRDGLVVIDAGIAGKRRSHILLELDVLGHEMTSSGVTEPDAPQGEPASRVLGDRVRRTVGTITKTT